MPAPKRSRPTARRDQQGHPDRLRMKDLVHETGLSRETIHFYISAGLVPAGIKTSRTTAEYSPDHVKRLLRIRQLREEQYLPLRVVKALVTDDTSPLTAQQSMFLRRVDTALAALFEEQDDVPLASSTRRPLTRQDLEVLAENGLIEIKRVGRRRMVSPADAEIVEVFACLREAGFTRERGYTGAELLIFDQAMEDLVSNQLRTGLGRLTDQPTEVIRDIIERSNPHLEQLMLVMRRKKLRRLMRGGAAGQRNREATSARRASRSRSRRGHGSD